MEIVGSQTLALWEICSVVWDHVKAATLVTRIFFFHPLGDNKYGYLYFGIFGGTRGSILTVNVLGSETFGSSSSHWA